MDPRMVPRAPRAKAISTGRSTVADGSPVSAAASPPADSKPKATASGSPTVEQRSKSGCDMGIAPPFDKAMAALKASIGGEMARPTAESLSA
ncbi:hypothetical protein Ctob_008887 [Chrysochromulina tobinii]|uniref:Uncharacterized protein n=1 Tax=Chrysochromulina tobinii TaxID=1460289 RepID=A0A0M0JCP4_9EUKA|nr:hypothetical protein Ctob_008887 [Chrysochromulina tobinii]|eukprot:KOO23968.1 hypothetical protein Ctob_008887 [Chrysochromulina sp. CCMP291]